MIASALFFLMLLAKPTRLSQTPIIGGSGNREVTPPAQILSGGQQGLSNRALCQVPD